jgi:L-lysine exporter family protein LysE/ArgO
MIIIFLKGFAAGASLIIAIGAQNAFVLSQGIKKHHYIIIPFICTMCDGVLIFLGISGAGVLIASNHGLRLAAGAAGAVFLTGYGFMSFLSAFKGGTLNPARQTGGISFKAAVLTTLAVTLLNPHVYIDTVLLLGSIAGQFQSPGHYYFGAGAFCASFIWFFSLSIGGRFLAPFFARQISWRILNACIGTIMWAIAVSLIKNMYAP